MNKSWPSSKIIIADEERGRNPPESIRNRMCHSAARLRISIISESNSLSFSISLSSRRHGKGNSTPPHSLIETWMPSARHASEISSKKSENRREMETQAQFKQNLTRSNWKLITSPKKLPIGSDRSQTKRNKRKTKKINLPHLLRSFTSPFPPQIPISGRGKGSESTGTEAAIRRLLTALGAGDGRSKPAGFSSIENVKIGRRKYKTTTTKWTLREKMTHNWMELMEIDGPNGRNDRVSCAWFPLDSADWFHLPVSLFFPRHLFSSPIQTERKKGKKK